MRRPLLIALLVLGIAPAAAPAAVPRDFAGIVDSHDPGPAQLERMSEATDLFRSNLYWPAVEPFVPGQRNWLRYDTLIGNAARAGLTVGEYAARLVKKAVVGVGNAEKPQVHAMIQRLLPGAAIAGPDAADALAVAITHAHHLASARSGLR